MPGGEEEEEDDEEENPCTPPLGRCRTLLLPVVFLCTAATATELVLAVCAALAMFESNRSSAFNRASLILAASLVVELEEEEEVVVVEEEEDRLGLEEAVEEVDVEEAVPNVLPPPLPMAEERGARPPLFFLDHIK